MKRQLIFNLENDQYVLKENGSMLFSIDAKKLEFISLDFYNGVYKNKSTAIELINQLSNDTFKKGNYIFACLNDIITSIQAEILEPQLEDTDTPYDEPLAPAILKTVHLYELAACAGEGFFMDASVAIDRDIPSKFSDADYAVKISGQSMEPTLADRSIVFVKQTAEINHNEIGIFLVDGDVMCKRYKIKGTEKMLCPDNKQYNQILITKEIDCRLLGKVLG